MKLDALDKAILSLVQDDSRLTSEEIARAVALSPTAVQRRLKRLREEAEGVLCDEPDGTLIGKVRVPETVANVTFGGPKNNRLYICATTSLYSVLLPVNGARA